MHGCLHWYRDIKSDSKVAQTSASMKGLVDSSAELNGYVPALEGLAHPLLAHGSVQEHTESFPAQLLSSP